MKTGKSIFQIHIFFLLLIIALIPPESWSQDVPNTITFDNKSGEHALVKVIGPSGQTVQVPNGENRLIHVAKGEYYILVRYGQKPEYYKYSKGDSFTVSQTSTQYSVTTITLHKVVGGNYSTHRVSADEFNNTPVIAEKVGRAKEAEKLSASNFRVVEPGSRYEVVKPLPQYELVKPMPQYEIVRPLKIEPQKFHEPPAEHVKMAEEWFKQGGSLFKPLHYDEAIAAYTKALELNPLHSRAYLMRGLVWGAKKDNGQAISDFSKVIELNRGEYSDIVMAYAYRGKHLIKQGDFDQAIEDLTKTTELAPSMMEFHVELGGAWEDKGRHLWTEVDSSHERNELKPGQLEKGMDTLIECLEKALESYRKALTVAPADKSNSVREYIAEVETALKRLKDLQAKQKSIKVIEIPVHKIIGPP